MYGRIFCVIRIWVITYNCGEQWRNHTNNPDNEDAQGVKCRKYRKSRRFIFAPKWCLRHICAKFCFWDRKKSPERFIRPGFLYFAPKAGAGLLVTVYIKVAALRNFFGTVRRFQVKVFRQRRFPNAMSTVHLTHGRIQRFAWVCRGAGQHDMVNKI